MLEEIGRHAPQRLPFVGTQDRTRHESLPSRGEAELDRDPMVLKAAQLMAADFEGVYRKTPGGATEGRTPYFVHLERVAVILQQAGYGPEAVAAGYLHDAVEDLPKLWSREKIAAEFSPRIAELVDWVTQQDKSLSWQERNDLYRERLRDAPAEAVAISAADKISNIESMLSLMTSGVPLRSVFKADEAENSLKFHGLLEIFTARLECGLAQLVAERLSLFDQMMEDSPLETVDVVKRAGG